MREFDRQLRDGGSAILQRPSGNGHSSSRSEAEILESYYKQGIITSEEFLCASSGIVSNPGTTEGNFPIIQIDRRTRTITMGGATSQFKEGYHWEMFERLSDTTNPPTPEELIALAGEHGLMADPHNLALQLTNLRRKLGGEREIIQTVKRDGTKVVILTAQLRMTPEPEHEGKGDITAQSKPLKPDKPLPILPLLKIDPSSRTIHSPDKTLRITTALWEVFERLAREGKLGYEEAQRIARESGLNVSPVELSMQLSGLNKKVGGDIRLIQLKIEDGEKMYVLNARVEIGDDKKREEKSAQADTPLFPPPEPVAQPSVPVTEVREVGFPPVSIPLARDEISTLPLGKGALTSPAALTPVLPRVEPQGADTFKNSYIMLTDTDIENIVNPPAENRSFTPADIRVLVALLKARNGISIRVDRLAKLISPHKISGFSEEVASLPSRIEFYKRVVFKDDPIKIHPKSGDSKDPEGYYVSNLELSLDQRIKLLTKRVKQMEKAPKKPDEYAVHTQNGNGTVHLSLAKNGEETEPVVLKDIVFEDNLSTKGDIGDDEAGNTVVYHLKASNQARIFRLLFKNPIAIRIIRMRLADDKDGISQRELQLYIDALNGTLPGNGGKDSLKKLGLCVTQTSFNRDDCITLAKYNPDSFVPIELSGQYDKTLMSEETEKRQRRRKPSHGKLRL